VKTIFAPAKRTGLWISLNMEREFYDLIGCDRIENIFELAIQIIL